MQKLLLFIFCCAICCCGFAQPSASVIKKYKIKKITATIVDDYDTKIVETFYNELGHDTAVVRYNERFIYNVYTYSINNRIEKIISYWAEDDKPVDTTWYIYKPDGSYMTKETDVVYKLTTKKWYNSKGKVIKIIVAAGDIYNYTYDSKGNMIKSIYTDGHTKKKKTIIYKPVTKSKNIYNKEGLIIKEFTDEPGDENVAPYKAVTTYEYHY